MKLAESAPPSMDQVRFAESEAVAFSVPTAVSPSTTANDVGAATVSGAASGGTTVTVTVSSPDRPSASVTWTVNVSTSSSLSPLGAVNVVSAADGADSVTVSPPVCLHAYCSVSFASGSSPGACQGHGRPFLDSRLV